MEYFLNEIDVFECLVHPKKLWAECIISSGWKSHSMNEEERFRVVLPALLRVCVCV